VTKEFELLQHFCRSDFWTFFLYAFGDGLSLKGEDWIDPAIHKPIADWFQHHVDEWFAKREKKQGEQKHLAVILPRETGKTRLITAAGQAWLHLRDPELSTYTGSESRELSAKMLGIIKAVFDGSDPHAMFTNLYGNWATAATRWAGSSITHAARKFTSRADPSLGTFAVETSITGAHPDAIFYDDPISYERMTTDTNWLRTVNSQVTSLYPVIQSDGLIVWAGTRYDDEDHFGVAFREEGIASITGMESESMQASEGGKWHVYFLAGRDAENKACIPKTWPERRLRDYEHRDPLRYAAQVMNDPSIAQTNPITRDQLRQCVIPPSQVPWTALRFAILTDVAFWDGKSRAAKDETVWLCFGYPRNGSGDVYYIEGCGSNTWRAEDFGGQLVRVVQRYRRQGRHIFALTEEVAMAGHKDAWRMALQNMFHDVNETMPTLLQFQRGRVKNDKIKRIVAASNFWVDGHVKVVEGAPGWQELMDQMARIGQMMMNPRIRNDRVDAAADAFQPELYQPMRRISPQKPPWDRGSKLISIDGLDTDTFMEEDHVWSDDCPRPPIK